MKKESVGFLSIAQNTESTNYLTLAYVQALSIKLVMPEFEYAVIVDENTANLIEEKHLQVFDYVIELENDLAYSDEKKFANEWQVFKLTPFRETIKVESDILFTRNISHWVKLFRLRDVVLSHGCKNYLGLPVKTTAYRRLFVDNALPDIYNGLMYFRYSKFASDFFNLAKQIFQNWDDISSQALRNCRSMTATTDEVYALTANILGHEKCFIPSADFVNFVHMKPRVNDWPNDPWCDIVTTELDLPLIRIANINQYYPVHYVEKKFITDVLVKEYENEFNRRTVKNQ